MNFTRSENKELNKPKISLQECKTILNKNGEKFSDEEVKEIRDFLYALIEIDYFHFQRFVKAKAEQQMETEESEKGGKVIQLNADENSDTKEFRQTG